MTIERFLDQLSQLNAPLLQQRRIEIEVDCDSNCLAITHEETLMQALSSILEYAAKCSPVGSRVFLSAFSVANGTEFEIADSSNLTADLARAGSFELAKAERDLRDAGVSVNVMNCPRGGVAYSMLLRNAARAAA